MGLFSKKRFVVSTILLAVEGEARRRIYQTVLSATERIVHSEGDFSVASEEISRAAEVLLAHEAAWSHIANWGEVFREETAAAQYGEESFADCAGRYLSATDEGDEEEGDAEVAEGNSVVMLTIAYEGENRALEKTLATREEVGTALSAVVALHRKDQLMLAHIHQSPGTIEEALDEDQLLVSYPEMLSL